MFRCHTAHDASDATPPCNHRTPPVQQALDELRSELSVDRVDLAELVVLGAGAKLAQVRAEGERSRAAGGRVADWIRSRTVPADADAADEVRRSGWTDA